MVSLNEYACIAYTATFNGEQDTFFVRADCRCGADLLERGSGRKPLRPGQVGPQPALVVDHYGCVCDLSWQHGLGG